MGRFGKPWRYRCGEEIRYLGRPRGGAWEGADGVPCGRGIGMCAGAVERVMHWDDGGEGGEGEHRGLA